MSGLLIGDSEMTIARGRIAVLTASFLCMNPAFAAAPPDSAYPRKPVTLVVGAAPGGNTDIAGRLVIGQLSKAWRKSFVVENRISVMGSVMALDYVSKQPADGYTLNVVSGSTYLNAALVSKVPAGVLGALDPVAQFTSSPLLMVLSAAVPARNLHDFIEYARKRPDQLRYASTGIGGSAHFAGEYFKQKFALSLVHVPYTGIEPAYKDMAAGRVHLSFAMGTSALPLVEKGLLTVVGVTSARPVTSLPNVPALGEVAKDFEYESFIGLVAPSGTPKPIVEALNRGVNDVLSLQATKDRLSKGGGTVTPMSPEGFGKSIRTFISKAEALVKQSKLDLRQNQ